MLRPRQRPRTRPRQTGPQTLKTTEPTPPTGPRAYARACAHDTDQRFLVSRVYLNTRGRRGLSGLLGIFDYCPWAAPWADPWARLVRVLALPGFSVSVVSIPSCVGFVRLQGASLVQGERESPCRAAETLWPPPLEAIE